MTTEILMPDRLKKFPLYKGKYVVHFTVYTGQDGEPDFKVVHITRQKEAYAKNLCHLCGERMQPPFAFIGGPKCVEYHGFMDGPMHEECARYAAIVCPYLANADGGHSKAEPKHSKEAATQIITNEQVVFGRPARMALCLTNSYHTGLSGGHVVAIAGEWISVDWSVMPERKS